MGTTNYLRIVSGLDGVAIGKNYHLHFFDDNDPASVRHALTVAHGALRRKKKVVVHLPTVAVQPDADVTGVIGLCDSNLRMMQLCALLRAQGYLTRADFDSHGVRSGAPSPEQVGTLGSDVWMYLGYWVSEGWVEPAGDRYLPTRKLALSPPDDVYPVVRERLAEIVRSKLAPTS